MIPGKDVMIIIRTDIIPELPSRMFFTSCHGRFVSPTTDGLKKRPHGRFKTSVWGNVRQGILYLVMGTSFDTESQPDEYFYVSGLGVRTYMVAT